MSKGMKMSVGKAVVCESELGSVAGTITQVNHSVVDGMTVGIKIGEHNNILDRCMFAKMVFGFDGRDFTAMSPDVGVQGRKLNPVEWKITRI